jgi:small subunit ribosomal protein S9
MEYIHSIGRRKSSIARVHVVNGKGNISINGRKLDDYFPQAHIQNKVTEPFRVAKTENTYDWKINVKGGGFKGQAEAIRMAIARALVKINEDFRSPLKSNKLLTRDARVVERKKYGKPKARKSFQFSKR